MEFVFVVPRDALFPESYPHGFQPFGSGPGSADAAHFQRVVEREGFFVERARAERAPQWKQVIPYGVVAVGGRVLRVQRTKRGGDARLHDKHSIGIGGHLEPRDLVPEHGRDPLPAGTRRELEEELLVRGVYEVRPIGWINDDSNPVGAVHVGVVQLVTVDGSVEVREREQLEGRLSSLEELDALLDRGADFETWSKLLVPRLRELLPTPTAARV
ncbi:MAG: NUDIX domain-containing protein [Planctomycetes bacterium]|nr:NUDIX domain-containing protein [Planctomycetota bacterium]